jgi:hypothetical protein
MLAAMAGIDCPRAFGKVQIVSEAKISKAQPPFESVSIAHTTPDVQPSFIGLGPVGFHEAIKFSVHDGARALPNARSWRDQILPGEFRRTSGDWKIVKFSIATKFPIEKPRNILRWQMAGISEPDITGQSAIKQKVWPNASNSNAQIGALKNFGESDLASSDTSKNNCEDGDKNSCDGENFIMKCGNCTPGIAQPVRSHKEKLEHAKAFLIIFGVFRAGHERARAKGVQFGRKPKLIQVSAEALSDFPAE